MFRSWRLTILLLGFAALIGWQATVWTSRAPALAVDSPEIGGDPRVLAAATKTFTITAQQWSFDPSTITVNQGDRVVLVVTSVDVAHGLSIPDFGVNETLTPGATVTAEFDATEAGTFSFFCNVSCGSGHPSMRGTLIVNATQTPAQEPNDEPADDDDESDDDADETPDSEDENTPTPEETATDTTGPTISGISAGDISQTQSTIRWATDEEAKSQVEYGTSSGVYTSETSLGDSFQASHRATLTGLSAKTRYFYRIKATDQSGNLTQSAESVFVTTGDTEAAPPPADDDLDDDASSTDQEEDIDESETTTGEEEKKIERVKTPAGGEVDEQTIGDTEPGELVTASSETQGSSSTEVVPPTLGLVKVNTEEYTIESALETAGSASSSESETAGDTPVSSDTSNDATNETQDIYFDEDDDVTFSGTAIPNATVTLEIRSDPIIATTQSDADGKWTYTLDQKLPKGDHSLRVAVTDTMGQQSEFSEKISFRVVEDSEKESANGRRSLSPEPEPWLLPAIGATVVVVIVAILLLIYFRRSKIN